MKILGEIILPLVARGGSPDQAMIDFFWRRARIIYVRKCEDQQGISQILMMSLGEEFSILVTPHQVDLLNLDINIILISAPGCGVS